MAGETFPYPPRLRLRAHWCIDPMPTDYLAWRESNTREAIAHHEAGHAVLMLALGVSDIRARLADDGSRGEVIPQRPDTPPELPPLPLAIEQANAIWCAAVYHAGVEAELLAGGFHAAMGTEWRGRATSDFEQADAALGALFFRGRPHGFAKATARAVLSRNREALDSIARCLIDAGEWQPSDTPGIAVKLGEDAAMVARACMAYGTEQPFNPPPSTTRPSWGQGTPVPYPMRGIRTAFSR